MKSLPALIATTLLVLVGAPACSSGEDDPELREASAWLKQIKAERREDAEWLTQQCVEERGFPLTRDGMIETVACMKRKDAELSASG